MSIVLRNRSYANPYSFRRVNGFDRLFDSFFDGYVPSQAPGTATATVSPRLNISESAAAYTVEAELPGVAKENVNISVDGKLVKIEAEVKRNTETREGETVVFAERSTEKFSRSFKLAVEVDDSKSVAKLENGVLTLTLPKKEALRPKQISVQ
ncbi:MAG: Hsp20/alpha crystallin family protein [Burkholderiaceae bacterium]|nr:Hsp20/alpha crystallin family protein [Burkholderiaceae bacterium]